MKDEHRRVHSFAQYADMAFLKILTRVFFHSGLLTLFNWWVNRFRLRTTSEGAMTFPFVQRRRSGNIQILTYHRVNAGHDPYFPAVPPEQFTEQMEYLASRFFVCPLTEAVARLQANDIPPNTVVVTFDDGYRDNYTHAFPILSAFSIPATIFLATAAIGSGLVLWHDRVFAAFRKTRVSTLAGYDKNGRTYSLNTLTERLEAQHNILRFLRAVDNQEREIWITRLMIDLQVEEKKEDLMLMLSWDEVRYMHQHGTTFGSHTMTHPILSTLSSEAMQQEIEESRAAILREIGVAPTAFAYPNGSCADFTPITKMLLRDAGYDCAVTTVFGVNEAGQDVFELRRGGPWEEHLPTFATKMNWYKI